MSKGLIMTGWFKGLLVCLLLAAPPNGPRAQDVDRLVIVRSSDNSFFNETIDTLVGQLDDGVAHEVVDLDGFSVETAPGDIYIGLGLPAIKAISSRYPTARAIHAYLTEEQLQQLERDANRFFVLLDQPLQRYLAFTHYLLKVSSIGILTDQPFDPELERMPILNRLDLDLSIYRVDADNKLLPVLRRLLREHDALLMLPRQSIYNPESLKGVLLSSYRQRRPVISYSPAHVRSGALASIYSSPIDIGRHLALLTKRSIANNMSPETDFHYARFFSISINRQVARSLGLALPGNAELRDQLDGLKQ